MYIIASPPRAVGDHRIFDVARQLEARLVHLGDDLGQHLRRVLAEPHVRLDLRDAGIALRRDELDPFGGRDAALQRRGDEPLHGVRDRARIRRF